MIEPVETLGDIRFDEPGGPGPGAGDLLQRGVAAFAGAETVRPLGELWLVVCLQQETDYFADEFVRPGRQAERPGFAVLFRDVDPLHRAESVALVAHRIGDASDLGL